MSGRIQYEAELILLSLTGGGWLMMAYDILRILRMAVRHNAFWTGVEDFFIGCMPQDLPSCSSMSRTMEAFGRMWWPVYFWECSSMTGWSADFCSGA